MNIFESIKNAIFHKKAEAAPAPAQAAPAEQAAPVQAAPETPAAPAAPVSISDVDVAVIMDNLADQHGQPSNWRTSIVDLMKLLDLDSSLSHRKELATELGYTGDMDDSATMNIWLHKEVMQKLAASGGIVPDDLK